VGPQEFIETNLVVPRGPLAGKPFLLLPWQQEVVQDIYGEGTTPVVREYYLSLPKKNAKTSFSSVILLYHLIGEPDEVCAEIYSAASSAKQALLIWKTAKQIVKASPKLRQLLESKKLEIHRDRMVYQAKNGERTYNALSSVADSTEGIDPSIVLIDELHAIRGGSGREFIDTLITATAGRKNPLVIYTTTAGSDLTTYCADIEKRIEKIEQNIIERPPGFNYRIHRAPKDLPWDSEEAFEAANPSYKVLVSKAFHREQVAKAKQSPTFRRAYCRYHLNQWVEHAESFIDMENWKACQDDSFDPAQLEGRLCFGALDLSRTTDLTAYVLLFPPSDDDPFHRVLAHAFLPNSDLRNRELRDGVPYYSWGEEGYIEFIDGKVIDFQHVVDHIRESRSLYDLQAIAYDPWDAKEVVRALDGDGLTLLDFPQWYKFMSPPTKKLLELIISQKLRHDGNPLVTWNISNLKVDMDANDNLKPNKRKSKEKIDIAVALIMAIGCATDSSDNKPFVSAYGTGVGTFKSMYSEYEETAAS